MLLTLKCLSVTFLSGFVVGVPLVWLVRRGNAPTHTDWLYAPFVGFGVITLVTHQTVYFDVRVLYSAPVIWGTAVALWVGLSARFGFCTAFRNCPWPILAATLGVYLFHALGVVLIGPGEYVGRAHSDRVNYNSLAQFLIDVPFSTDWEQLGQRPYLVDGMKLKQDRIGVMALLAFLSVSVGEWAPKMFEPTILLGPALVVPALALFCRQLGFSKTETSVAAVAGGLAPGLATLHTCCFLANVVAIPFAFASAATTAAVLTAPSIRRVLLVVVLYAATASLYTEFAPLLVAIAAGGAVFAALFGRCGRVVPFAVAALALVLSLAIYPRSDAAVQLEPIRRCTADHGAGHPMEWMWTERLIGSAWVCDLAALNEVRGIARAATVVGAVLTLAALAGLLRLLCATVVASSARPSTGVVAALLLVSLAVGPVFILLSGRYEYQGTKLALSFVPLMAVGVVALLRPRAEPSAGTAWPWGAVAAALRPATTFAPAPPMWRRRAMLALVGLFALGTGSLVFALTGSGTVPCSNHTVLRDPWLGVVKFGLQAMPPDNVVLAVGPGGFHNSDLSLAARRHNVWLVCPEINDGHTLGCAHAPMARARYMVDLNTVPKEALVFTLKGERAAVRIEGDAKLLQEVGPYQQWRVGPGPYALVPTAHAKRPPELDRPSSTATAQRN